jgi:hypothetical protein
MEARKADAIQKTEGHAVADSAGRKPGRRKTKVRELFEREGPEVAWGRGLRLGLKESRLRTWFAHWRRVSKGGSQII